MLHMALYTLRSSSDFVLPPPPLRSSYTHLAPPTKFSSKNLRVLTYHLHRLSATPASDVIPLSHWTYHARRTTSPLRTFREALLFHTQRSQLTPHTRHTVGSWGCQYFYSLSFPFLCIVSYLAGAVFVDVRTHRSLHTSFLS